MENPPHPRPRLPAQTPAPGLVASLRALREGHAANAPDPRREPLDAAFHFALDRLIALLVVLATRFASGEPFPLPAPRAASRRDPASPPRARPFLRRLWAR